LSDSGYLLDSNVWVALTFDTHPAHRAASEAFLLATEHRPAAFCRATQQSYLRLASNPTILRTYNATGLTNRDALKTLGIFMARPVVAYREEPDKIVGLGMRWPTFHRRHRNDGWTPTSPHSPSPAG